MSDLEFCSQERGRPKHVYLMDMNELYHVVVRLPGWEFMAEASHINANKAVRGLAADLQDFYEEGQRSSAAHLMQQGARAALADQAAGDRAAIEAVGKHTALTGELVDLELADRRFELKRKTEDCDQSLKERQMTLSKQKLELVGGWRIEIAAMKRPQ